MEIEENVNEINIKQIKTKEMKEIKNINIIKDNKEKEVEDKKDNKKEKKAEKEINKKEKNEGGKGTLLEIEKEINKEDSKKEKEKKGEDKNNTIKIEEEKKKQIKTNEIKEVEEKGNDKQKQNDKEKEKKEFNLMEKNIFPRGLNNIGATCYMNSVLQCFYHIYDLSNELLKYYNNLDESKLPLTSAYIDVIINLSFNNNQSISPYKFKEIISKNNELFRGIEANDSKTLTLYLLDTINEEFNDNNIYKENKKISNRIRTLNEKGTESIVRFFNSQYNSMIADLFNGLKKTTYTCLKCRDIAIDYQICNIISLSIEQTYNEKYGNKNKKKNKEKSIDILDCFVQEEMTKLFTGDNQIFCEKCQNMRNGESISKIYMTSKIMIIFLDRGKYNRFKCNVSFPEELNLSKFVEKKCGNETFILIGAIEHLGPSSMGGHFIANCRHFDGKFYIFSDSSISNPSNRYQQYGEPYLLFYRRKD